MTNLREPDQPAARKLIAQTMVKVPYSQAGFDTELLRILSDTLTRTISAIEFNSLLAHATQHAGINCPAWMTRLHTAGGGLDFGILRRCLASHDVDQAASMINRLWDAMIGQLILLIGEHLTALQFRRAILPIMTASLQQG